ncbi:hypothetical protein PIIN_00865 [Serendipita indica DSM 11827]|uniref:Uncharacterized protein n=1 Tax=Serendipita indica (strain DSM 11827) TaxID=1109443 RepID=G4T6R2_SERID|nr:hypothetical protein PIIN_00865 [Serendipita indica DSM 11827]
MSYAIYYYKRAGIPVTPPLFSLHLNLNWLMSTQTPQGRRRSPFLITNVGWIYSLSRCFFDDGGL